MGSLNPALTRLEEMARGRRTRRGRAEDKSRGRSADAVRPGMKTGTTRRGRSPPTPGGERKTKEEEEEKGTEESDDDDGMTGAAEAMEGSRIVSASVDNTVRVWDPRDMRTLYTCARGREGGKATRHTLTALCRLCFTPPTSPLPQPSRHRLRDQLHAAA